MPLHKVILYPQNRKKYNYAVRTNGNNFIYILKHRVHKDITLVLRVTLYMQI